MIALLVVLLVIAAAVNGSSFLLNRKLSRNVARLRARNESLSKQFLHAGSLVIKLRGQMNKEHENAIAYRNEYEDHLKTCQCTSTHVRTVPPFIIREEFP